MCNLEYGTPVDKKPKPKTELEQLREDNRKLCARIDEREADLARELERNMQLHAENKQQREEIARMDQKMTELREGSALIMHGFDISTQLISALIAWMPEGQVLPDSVGGLKLQLDQVWEKLRSKL